MSNARVYEMVTEDVIKILESGTAPWRKPWSVSGGGSPRNVVSGKAYRGVNVFLLLARGRGTPYWLSFKQVKQLGGRVRKGESGTLVIFWKITRVNEKQPDGSVEQKQIPLLRWYKVWNLDQTEGVRLPKRVESEIAAGKSRRPATDAERVDAAEKILIGYAERGGPVINEDGGARAFYRPGTDSIHLPAREAFGSASEFYSTAFHEVGHSTGHASRLSRHEAKDQFVFGSHAYGREELVAEMTAAFLSAEAEILPRTIDNSAAYLRSWIKTIKEDTAAVVWAAGRAQKAADHILGREWGAEESEKESEPADVSLAA